MASKARGQVLTVRAEIILFAGGLLVGACLTLAAAIGWYSVAAAERLEARR